VTEPTPEPPVEDPQPEPDPNPEPDEDPTPTPEPEEPPAEAPAACPPYPNDPSITCELTPGHSVRMIHRRSTGPDQPYYEWE
jgi:hypothetical protein